MKKNRTKKYSLIFIFILITLSLSNYIIIRRKLIYHHRQKIELEFFLLSLPQNCYFQIKPGFSFKIEDCKNMKIGEHYTIIGTVNSLIDNKINYQNNIDVEEFFIKDKNKLSFFDLMNKKFIILQKRVDDIQQKLLFFLRSHFQNDSFQLITSLTLGNRAFDFDQELKQQISEIGLSHMVAVSGFHLSLIMSVWGAICKPINNRKVFLCLSLSGLIFYILLVGSPLSVLRAGIMWTFSFIGRYFFYKQTNSFLGLFLAFVIMFNKMILNITNVGFLLSFFATLGVILVSNNFHKIEEIKNEIISLDLYNRRRSWFKLMIKGLKEAILVSSAAQLFTLPIVIAFFHEIAWSGIISNLVFSFLITLIVVLSTNFLVVFLFTPNFLEEIVDKLIIFPLAFYLEKLSSLFYKIFYFYSGFFGGLLPFDWEIPKNIIFFYYFFLFLGLYLYRKRTINRFTYVETFSV